MKNTIWGKFLFLSLLAGITLTFGELDVVSAGGLGTASSNTPVDGIVLWILKILAGIGLVIVGLKFIKILNSGQYVQIVGLGIGLSLLFWITLSTTSFISFVTKFTAQFSNF